MSMSSMDILLHRYLDGDLTSEESEALLNDVALHPALMERLEAEARLNMAIIDDAYSIEPPDEVRTMVLDAIRVSQRSPLVPTSWFRGAVASVLLMLCTVFPTSGPVLHDMVRSTTHQVHVNESSTVHSTTAHTTTSTHRVTKMQDAVVDRSNEPAAETDDSVVLSSFVRSLPEASTVAVPVLQEVGDRPMEIRSYTPPTFRLLDGIGGIVSPTTVSLRLSAIVSERFSMFAEFGSMQLEKQTTQFVNNVRQQTLQSNAGAFASVGATYSMPVYVLGDRFVSASAAIGIQAVGAFGLVDLTADILSIQGLVLQAGARMRGGPGLQGSVEPMMLLRVRL